MKAVGAKDEVGVRELVQRRQVAMVADGTAVLILSEGWMSTEVRVTAGPQTDRRGWVPMEMVRS